MPAGGPALESNGVRPIQGVGKNPWRTDMPDQIPLVDYLALTPAPHLVAHECVSCGARYFDRRNACASCFAAEFRPADIATTGEVRAFTIVSLAAPGIPVPV